MSLSGMRSEHLLTFVACLLATGHCRVVSPRVVSASHSLQGYGPERTVDGNEQTYWLVPGGQRMEAMS